MFERYGIRNRRIPKIKSIKTWISDVYVCIYILQVALFYVAVLAGLLHRFPVRFSQVRI